MHNFIYRAVLQDIKVCAAAVLIIRSCKWNVLALFIQFLIYPGICSSPLGLEDGRIRYGQLTSSSYQKNNPADAGRLNIIPNV